MSNQQHRRSRGSAPCLDFPSTAGHVKVGLAEVLTIDLEFVSSLPATRIRNLESNTRPGGVAVVMFTSGRLVCQSGCVRVPTDVERMNNLGAAMEHMKVNWACLTTTVASTLVSMSPAPSHETLILAGESITTEAVEYWNPRVKQLGNMYGPCESSVFAVGTTHINPRDPIPRLGRVTCGHAWIVDQNDHTKIVAIGSVDELYSRVRLWLVATLMTAERLPICSSRLPHSALHVMEISPDASRRVTWPNSHVMGRSIT
ncbi:hypothetical protein J3459_013742 [Metarhizium acridum]|nr:hypothetical protein J3459_013742 [Metarhizium acridum]